MPLKLIFIALVGIGPLIARAQGNEQDNRDYYERLKGQARQLELEKKKPRAERFRKARERYMADPEKSGLLTLCRRWTGEPYHRNEMVMHHFKRGCVAYELYNPNDNAAIEDLTPKEIEEGLDMAMGEFRTAVKADPKFAEGYAWISTVYYAKVQIYLRSQHSFTAAERKISSQLMGKGGKTSPDYTAKAESFVRPGLEAALVSIEIKMIEHAAFLLQSNLSLAANWHTPLPKSILARCRKILESQPRTKKGNDGRDVWGYAIGKLEIAEKYSEGKGSQ